MNFVQDHIFFIYNKKLMLILINYLVDFAHLRRKIKYVLKFKSKVNPKKLM